MNLISLDIKNDERLYRDFTSCLLRLNQYWSTIDINEIESRSKNMIFHTYTEFKDRKQLMVAASFLATQPEDSVMIVWSDYEVSDHPLFNHGGGRLINRIWRPTVEAENTLLEGNLELLNARDERYWLQSDLCRLLVLYKYGGTWLDMDVILMNSFCPLYGIEYLYAWGGDLDFGRQGACGTVMSVNKGSYFGYQMLTSLANIEPRANTTCWGKELFAEVYRCESYRVLPCTFFNTEWCINLKYPGFAEYVELGWFRSRWDNVYYLFPEAFAWHWHNSSKNKMFPERGSKFHLLSERTFSQLEEKGYINLVSYLKTQFGDWYV